MLLKYLIGLGHNSTLKLSKLCIIYYKFLSSVFNKNMIKKFSLLLKNNLTYLIFNEDNYFNKYKESFPIYFLIYLLTVLLKSVSTNNYIDILVIKSYSDEFIINIKFKEKLINNMSSIINNKKTDLLFNYFKNVNFMVYPPKDWSYNLNDGGYLTIRHNLVIKKTNVFSNYLLNGFYLNIINKLQQQILKIDNILYNYIILNVDLFYGVFKSIDNTKNLMILKIKKWFLDKKKNYIIKKFLLLLDNLENLKDINNLSFILNDFINFYEKIKLYYKSNDKLFIELQYLFFELRHELRKISIISVFNRNKNDLDYYLNYEKLYLCYNIDFRGRMYALGELHHQSHEFIRSIIRSDKYYNLTEEGFNNIKIYCTRAYYGKKTTDSDCLNYFKENLEIIILKLANETLFYDSYIFKSKLINAKNKLFFLKSIYELVNIYKYLKLNNNNIINYKTNFLVEIDCVASVIQLIYVVLYRYLTFNDFNNVNLYGKKNDLMDDFYLFMIKQYLEIINKTFLDIEKEWGLVKLDLRKIFKKAIMTKLYNASVETLKKYIEEDLIDVLKGKNLNLSLFNFKTFNIFINNFCEFLDNFYIYNALSELFNKILNNYKNDNLPISWELPFFEEIMDKKIKIEYNTFLEKKSQLNFKNNFFELNNNKISTFNLPKSLSLYSSVNKTIDLKANQRSFLPNFIHSLDALAAKYVEYLCLKNDIVVLSIHDCFMVHPNFVLNIKDYYLDYLVKLIEIDYFDKELIPYLISNLKKKEDKKLIKNLYEKFQDKFLVQTFKDKELLEDLKKKIKESYDAMILG